MRLLIASYVFCLVVSPAALAGTDVWTSNGPGGGTIWDVAVHPTNGATLWAGTEGGLFKSTDSGASWSLVSAAPTGDRVSAIRIHPTTPNTMYIVTLSHGIWKTTNGGTTWSLSSDGLPLYDASANIYEDLMSLAIDPVTPSTLYAGTWQYGIYKSTDSGANWSWSGDGLYSDLVTSIVVDPASPSTVYAGMQARTNAATDGVYRSTDGGATWSPFNTGLTAASSGRYLVWDLELNPATSTLYVATSTKGLFKRTTSGSGWTQLASTTITEAFSIAFATGTTYYVGGRGGVFKTTNDSSFALLSSGLSGGFHATLTRDPGDATKLYTGNNGALFRSTNGGTSWTRSTNGLNAARIQSLARERTSGVLVAGGSDSLFKSTDQGGTWTQIGGTTFATFTMADVDIIGNTIYALLIPNGCRSFLGGGRFTKSTDGGTTWSAFVDLATEQTVRALAVHRANPNVMYATSNDYTRAILKSTNGGASWTDVTGNFSLTSDAPVVVHPTNAQIAYVGGQYGVYKTIDGGATWNAMDGGGAFFFSGISAIAMDPSDPEHLWVADRSYAYETTNGGLDWTETVVVDYHDIYSEYSEFGAKAIAIDPESSDRVLVSTRKYGVFRTIDGGVNWTPYTNGLADPWTLDLVAAGGGTVHVGTIGGSVSSITSTTINVTPPVLTATANASSATLNWTAVAGYTQFDVERKSYRTDPYAFVARVTGTAYVDATVTEGYAYLYRVTPVGSDVYSNVDWATAVTFAGDPLVSGMVIAAQHVLQLRTAVRALTEATESGWWQGYTNHPTLAGAPIRAVHVTELREELAAALAELGKTFTPSEPSLAGVPMRAVHLQELRNAVK